MIIFFGTGFYLQHAVCDELQLRERQHHRLGALHGGRPAVRGRGRRQRPHSGTDRNSGGRGHRCAKESGAEAVCRYQPQTEPGVADDFLEQEGVFRATSTHLFHSPCLFPSLGVSLSHCLQGATGFACVSFKVFLFICNPVVS